MKRPGTLWYRLPSLETLDRMTYRTLALGFPFLTFVSMRGNFGEGNPWQYAMGQATPNVLAAMGVICLTVDRPEDVLPTASAACTMAFQAGNAVAVLLTQRLLGAKQF